MRNISFAWTTPALVAGAKTVTRREWTDRYARWFKKDMLVAAYDRQPRFKGKKVATLRLTADAKKERYNDVTDDDWEDEGFAWLQEHGINMPVYDKGRRRRMIRPSVLFRTWRGNPDPVWVVRFEVISFEGE